MWDKLPLVIRGGDKWYVVEIKLGEGSFGGRCLGTNIDTKPNMHTKKKVEIKVERIDVSTPTLEKEVKFYKYIGHTVGFPKIYHFRQAYPYRPAYPPQNNEHSVLIMEALGKDIESKFQELDRSFPLKTILMIGLQMTDRIERMHSEKVIFRLVLSSLLFPSLINSFCN